MLAVTPHGTSLVSEEPMVRSDTSASAAEEKKNPSAVELTTFQKSALEKLPLIQRGRLQLGEIDTLLEKSGTLYTQMLSIFNMSNFTIVGHNILHWLPIVGDIFGDVAGCAGAFMYLYRYCVNRHLIDAIPGFISEIEEQIEKIKQEIEMIEAGVYNPSLGELSKEAAIEQLNLLKLRLIDQKIKLEDQISQTKNDLLWCGLNIASCALSTISIVCLGPIGFLTPMITQHLKPFVFDILSSGLSLTSKTITAEGYDNLRGWGDQKREETRESNIQEALTTTFPEYSTLIEDHGRIAREDLAREESSRPIPRPSERQLERSLAETKEEGLDYNMLIRQDQTRARFHYTTAINPAFSYPKVNISSTPEAKAKASYKTDALVAYRLNKSTVTNKTNIGLAQGKKCMRQGQTLGLIAIGLAFIPVVGPILSLAFGIVGALMILQGSHMTYHFREEGAKEQDRLEKEYQAQIAPPKIEQIDSKHPHNSHSPAPSSDSLRSVVSPTDSSSNLFKKPRQSPVSGIVGEEIQTIKLRS